MKVENLSNKVIGIGTTTILPGEIKELQAGEDTNPALSIYEGIGLIKTTGKASGKKAEKVVDESEAEDVAAEAIKKGINPATAMDQADLKAKVRGKK